MSVSLTVGSETFEYPTTGDNAASGWGDNATGWATAVTDVLKNVQNPNDITLSSYPLVVNQTTFADIVGLRFSTSSVLFIEINYVIDRVLSPTGVYVESGKILGNYDGTNFNISIQSVGDAGVFIDVDSTGQFIYKSTSEPSSAFTIKFKASTIQY